MFTGLVETNPGRAKILEGCVWNTDSLENFSEKNAEYPLAATNLPQGDYRFLEYKTADPGADKNVKQPVG